MERERELFLAQLMQGITNRINRLHKLVGLNAPAIVIYKEVEDLRRHTIMLGEGRYHADCVREKGLEDFNRAKGIYGVCCTPGCFGEAHRPRNPADDAPEMGAARPDNLRKSCVNYPPNLRKKSLPI